MTLYQNSRLSSQPCLLAWNFESHFQSLKHNSTIAQNQFNVFNQVFFWGALMQISQVSYFICPRLFQPQIHNLKVNTQASEDNYIPLPKVHNSKELLRHKQFPKIQQQFLSDISTLKRLAHTYVNHTYDTKINSFYNKIKGAYAYTDSNLLLIYEKTRFEIHNIVAEISKPQNNESHDYIANFLRGCLEDIDYCLAGVASRFNFSISNLNIMESGLQGFIYKIRHELAHEFISKFTIEQEKQGALHVSFDYKVHYFNAFYNLLSENAKLESISDMHAPKSLSDNLVKAFYKAAPLHINGFSIVQRLAQYWANKLSSTLKKQNLAHWETSIILAKEMTFEQLEKINSSVFNAINSLHGTKGAAAINFSTVTEEIENSGYAMSNFQEKIHAWLANYFCDEAPKVFCKVCTNEYNVQYIGSMSNLFFWVFNFVMPLNIKAHCDFNLSNHISLTLNHLITLDFNTWPAEHFHPLLMQAVSQTKTADDFLSFFSNDFVLRQLHNLSDTTRTMFFNCIVEKYIASKNETFKQLLCKCVVYYVLFQDKKLIFNTKLAYFEDTPLYHGIEQEIQNDCDALRKIIKKLPLPQLLHLAYKHIEIVFQETNYDIKYLIDKAIHLKKIPFLAQLVKSSFADRLLDEQDDYKSKLLLSFIKHNDSEAMECVLLRANINVNFKDEDGNTPLLHAAKYGRANFVRILLAHNNINLTSEKNDQNTVLQLAAQLNNTDCPKVVSNDIKQTPDIKLGQFNFITYLNPLPFLQSLLWNNAYVNQQNTIGRTALQLTLNKGQTQCSKTFVDIKPIQINMQNNIGWAALHYTARNGHIACLKNLLSSDNIQVNKQKADGWTALHLAANNGHADCLKALLNTKDIQVNMQNNDGWTALHLAANKGHGDCLKALLNAKDIQVNMQDNSGRSALHLAANKGHGDCLKALLNAKDIQVNMQDNTGRSALHLAANKGNADCLKALLNIKNIQVNMQDNTGRTVLHFAADYGHASCCLKALMNVKDIQVNVQDNTGRTALHFAADYGQTACLKALMSIRDIQVNMQNNEGWTALHYAAEYGHIACLKNLLSSHNIQVNKQRNDGWTALHCAARYGRIACLKLLLSSHNIQVNQQNNVGSTALHLAANEGHGDCLKTLLNIKEIHVNMQNNRGWTALHCAVYMEHAECVKILLSSNTLDINKRDNQYRTPLNLAKQYSHVKCVKLLLNHD